MEIRQHRKRHRIASPFYKIAFIFIYLLTNQDGKQTLHTTPSFALWSRPHGRAATVQQFTNRFHHRPTTNASHRHSQFGRFEQPTSFQHCQPSPSANNPPMLSTYFHHMND
jgi:hypothetical protein